MGTPAAVRPHGGRAVAYRGRLVLQHTGSGVVLDYEVRRASDDVVVMSHSVADSVAAMTEFDTVAFYMSKNASQPQLRLHPHGGGRRPQQSVTRAHPAPYQVQLALDGGDRGEGHARP